MGKKFNGFVLGAAVGSLAALLLAPKSGKELRQALSSKANEKVSATKGQKHEEIAEEVTARLQEQTENIARQLREARMETASGDLTPTEAMDQVTEEEIVVPVSESIADEILVEEQNTNEASANTEELNSTEEKVEEK